MRNKKRRRGREIQSYDQTTARFLNPDCSYERRLFRPLPYRVRHTPALPTCIGTLASISSLFEPADYKIGMITADLGKLAENTLQVGKGAR
ncbi:hypothetical protein C4580_00200 [Candidatus Woesearchaeota archaeon]|nr:MAG: hypothetical protein C4580_00200 [Candidatus Woesearchaeota archaeon]